MKMREPQDNDFQLDLAKIKGGARKLAQGAKKAAHQLSLAAASATAPVKYCTGCGAKLKEDAKFCSHCGKPCE